ncbi:TIGR03960 family B12-binding radical SAM protein [Anaeromyxobacter oryzae]|uniref:B12-binding protein n=1 Tax=Anaeromyxobacter oryzae TaxID=2918170 RepID=A0ABM7WXV1_9BACT|nr:TIGR03960 family B12-binding radical SAM protein [Anaeromyxobacter oryzae]BDG04353.1 B12-binding protein [Anaeromyxobacter oryzae]
MKTELPAASALDALVLRAQKPSRYVGAEFGAIVKDLRAVRVRFALAFPDTYEVGMSNLGFRLLYHLLNDRPDVACERVFLPWPDMEGMLRERGLPLFTLESRAAVRDFDVLGITLQFELAYTSALAMLDLAGIPLLARDRGDHDPLVVGGGPCAYNPEPVADFFDCFAVGEGEEVALEISDAVASSGFRRGGASRRELLERLARIPGVYVPSLFRPVYDPATRTLARIEPLLPGYEKVERRVMPDLNALPTTAYTRPLVPFMQTIHDRLPIELQRGCTRGCRFCQVGMITRPTRQRDPKQVLHLAELGLKASGYEEVGLLSLSSGDYAPLNGLLDDFLARWEGEKIAMSLPSLRTETMSDALAKKIARIRKTGFTLAPEAATERMRAVINKGNREEDLLRAVGSIFSNGWSLLKLYFMIGLPEERDEDVVAIAELAKKSLAAARRALPKGQGSAAIHLGASTFVPKPFTPFQWEPMIPPEETRRRQGLITAALGGRNGAIQFKPHDSRQSSIEGALALGDRRVGTAVLAAYRMGQRLDGWTEWFDEDRWIAAFEACEREHGVGLDWFAHRRRRLDEVLPWDRIDCGVTKAYLQKQLAAARNLAEVVDCVLAPCTVCGACDYDVVKNRTYDAKDYVPEPPPPPRPPEPPTRTFVRVRYTKLGRLVALSHLETMHALLRAIRRAGLPVAYSQGFHPKPRVSFGPALPVGVESVCEYLDLELVGPADPAEVLARLVPELPEGLRAEEAVLLDPQALSISEAQRAVHYRVEFSGETWSEATLAERVDAFRASTRALVTRAAPPKSRHRGRNQKVAVRKEREIDLKEIVTHLAVEGPGSVAFSLRADPSGSAKPAEVLAAIFGEGLPPQGVKVLKEGVSFARNGQSPGGQPRAPRYLDA